jgi:hypothetical protein
MRHSLGNPESFLPNGPALGERAQLGMARGEVTTGVKDPRRKRRGFQGQNLFKQRQLRVAALL